MRLTDRQRKIGRTVYNVQHEIARALLEEKSKRGVTQQALSKKLGVDRSVVNRRVTGRSNLTLRSIAELAWALNREVEFRLVPAGVEQSVRVAPQAERGRWEQMDPRELESIAFIASISEQEVRSFLRTQQPRHRTSRATNDNWAELVPAPAAKAA
jgi:transcriptional regulator with XRE-family HTH domain